jgi:hypothetical protein
MVRLDSNRGQIRIIEAFFASVLLLSSLALVPTETTVPKASEQTLVSLAKQVLITLDSDGSLSALIENASWITLGKCIEALLSPTLWFNLTVFDENMVSLKDICSGTPISGEEVAIEYLCASSSTNYQIYFIRFQLSTVN